MVALRLTLLRQIDVTALSAAAQRGAEKAMPAVAEALREAVDNCFETETDPFGNPWPALAPATLAQRARANKVGKILQRDGVLRRSVFGSPTTATEGVTRAYVAAGGPAAAYAATQQFGSEDGTTPARPYMPILPDGSPSLPVELQAEIAATIKESIVLELQEERRAAE